MKRYTIHPIADETCSSLNVEKTLAACTSYESAKAHAVRNSSYQYGSGILDTETGEIDVGFGFGVLCPDWAH